MNKRVKCNLIFIVLLMLMTPLALAEYTIDISGLESEAYNLGEDINFKVLLLEDGNLIEDEVDIKIADALNRREIIEEVTSGQNSKINIENNFPSGIWTMTASYLNTSIDRTFTISENAEIEFIIEKDNLIIRNKGNVRYTKTIQIIIGDNVNSYAQNIGVGKEKILKLVSPEGIYDIKISDGETTIQRQNIKLYGTGNVIGAIDIDLVGYTGFAGVDDPRSVDQRGASLKKIPSTLIFIFAVLFLAILVFIERKLSKAKQTGPYENN
ncbi:MAG: hypothetical protein IH845_05485 [Nanoarchaeota archaeon]|nr:hypothetical protein [Nanoarchaeota archaeon]